MAVYEFRCTGKCDRIIEIQKAMTDPNPEVCPVCGGSIQRVWGNTGVIYGDGDFTLYKGRNEAGEPMINRK